MKYKGIIMDLEGTLLSSGIPIPNALEFLSFIIDRKIQFRIITNTVSKSNEDFSKIFHGFGMEVPSDMFISPSVSLNTYMEEVKASSFYFVGPDYMKVSLEKSGDFESIPEYVVLYDFEHIECNYELFNRIFYYLTNGSKLITASNSEYYLSKNGPKIDTGAFARMFEVITNQRAIVLGKPSKLIYKVAADQMGLLTKEIITVGDDVLTDIKGAKEFGVYSVLVRSGKYKNGDEDIYAPDRIINSLIELKDMF